MHNKLIFNIIRFIVIGLYIALGIYVLINTNTLQNVQLGLGIILLISSVIELCAFFFYGKFRKEVALAFGAFAIVGIILSILYICNTFNLEQLTVSWGIFEMTKGVFGTFESIYIFIKEKEYPALIDAGLSIAEIILGILLAIEESGHLHVHLVFVGISLLLTAAIEIIETIIFFRNQKKQDLQKKD